MTIELPSNVGSWFVTVISRSTVVVFPSLSVTVYVKIDVSFVPGFGFLISPVTIGTKSLS